MSEYQEFTGKTVEEALRSAREEFGVAGLDDLDFEILTQGSRGVLGMGAEPARIIAAPRSALGGATPKKEAAEAAPPPPPAPKPEGRPRRESADGDRRRADGDRRRSGSRSREASKVSAEATAEVFVERDGKRFLRTGDLGYCDDDGYFFHVDRLKRMINVSGLKVWPAEVEAMLYEHEAVKEACIIAARDERRGETVKAVIIPQEDIAAPGPEALEAWCRERMAAYKVPRLYEYVDSLPRTAAGKILWRELQAREDATGP